jgi:lipoprotein-releasing system permease protein
VPIEIHIALTHLLGRQRATLVSIVGVAVGVGLFIGASSLLSGSQQEFIDRMINAAPHIIIRDEYRVPPTQPAMQVYSAGAIELLGVKPRSPVRGIKDANGIVNALEERPGVSAAPALIGLTILAYGGREVSAALYGIDPGREPRVSRLAHDMVAGRVGDLESAPNAIILGVLLAERLGARLGDTLTATARSGATFKMKVVGLYRTGVVSVDRIRSYALLRRVQALLDRPNVVNQIRVQLDEYTEAHALAEEIEGRYRFRAESWVEANEDILALLEIRNLIMYTIVGSILVVASLGIYNVISTVVHEKARDIAILKSMGFEALSIQRVFLLEGLIVGVAGSALGGLIGFSIIHGLASVRIEMREVIEVQRFVMDYSPIHYAIAGGFAVISSLLASYLPARRAAALRPVDILRGAA